MRWNPFSTEQIDGFARTLADELARRYPAEVEAGEKDEARSVKTERRLRRTLESVYGKAREYRERERLGVYRRARLGNTFKWDLLERGYAEAFVEEVTHGLVVTLSRR